MTWTAHTRAAQLLALLRRLVALEPLATNPLAVRLRHHVVDKQRVPVLRSRLAARRPTQTGTAPAMFLELVLELEAAEVAEDASVGLYKADCEALMCVLRGAAPYAAVALTVDGGELTLTAGAVTHEVGARRVEEIRSFLPCGGDSHSEVVLQHGFQLQDACAPAVDAPLQVLFLRTLRGAVLATEAGGELRVVGAPSRKSVALPGGWQAEFNAAECSDDLSGAEVVAHTAVVSAADVSAVVQDTPYTMWTARFARGGEMRPVPALLVRQSLEAFVDARCWFPCGAVADTGGLVDRLRGRESTP